jgi:hypothetical protein
MVDVVALVVGKTVCREGPSLQPLCVETTRMAIYQPWRDDRNYCRRSLVDLALFQGFCSARAT